MSPLWGLSNDDVKTIGAGATTVGVLLALFTPPVRRWWRNPMLSIEYDASLGGPNWDRLTIKDETFFLRLRVRNARGCDAAQDVQVLVAQDQTDNLGLGGHALEWSGQHTRGETPVTALRVPPGLQRHVDLLKITPRETQRDEQAHDAAPRSDAAPPFDARICVYPKPQGEGHHVPVTGPCGRKVVLIVSAANADSISYELTFSYDGDLSADLLGMPQLAYGRGLFTVLKAVLKLALAGFRTSKV